MIALATLLCTLSAHAGMPLYELRDERLAELAAEVLPQVEAIAGRTFVAPVPVRFRTRRSVCSGQLELQPAQEGQPAVVITIGQHLRSLACKGGLNGVYLSTLGEIAILGDSLNYPLEEGVTDPAKAVEPVLKCLLAHELTHALTHQRADRVPWTKARHVGWSALNEGIAQVVEARVCAGLGANKAMVQSAQQAGFGAASAFDPEDDHALRYVYGPMVIEALMDRGGMPAVWSALASPVPDQDMVAAVAANTVHADWRSPGVLADIGAFLAEPKGWSVETSPAPPPSWVVEQVSEGAQQSTPVRVLAGMQVATGTDFDWAQIRLYRFESADGAAQMVAARRKYLSEIYWDRKTAVQIPTHLDGVYVRGEPAIMPIPSLARRDGVDAFLHMSLKPGTYREIWIAMGPVLVDAELFGEAIPEGRFFKAMRETQDRVQILRDLQPSLPAGADAWLNAASTHPEPDPAHISESYLRSTVNRPWRMGDTSACTTALQAARERIPDFYIDPEIATACAPLPAE